MTAHRDVARTARHHRGLAPMLADRRAPRRRELPRSEAGEAR